MNPRTQNLIIAFALCLVVIGFGALDDWYREFNYGADGISYFDQASAIRNGEWTSALNPYWSIGYPLVLAATRWMFPAGPFGEWTGIHVVNLVIYVLAFVSFLAFLRTAVTFAAQTKAPDERPRDSRLMYILGSLIFVEWQVQINNVARTTPDLLVSAIFFLLMAVALNFCMRPAVKFAVAMGLLAGIGYVCKAVFLPLSFAVFLMVGLRMLTQGRRDFWPSALKLAWVAPALALVALPYIIGQSVVLGRPTLGESGSLNYAWTVNKLTHWHWTGGPAQFGTPIHPVRVLSESPRVYEFAEPMHVTYPPFYNPFYWYEGYHHFFNLKNQIAAIKPNLFELTDLFFDMPHSPLKVAMALAVMSVIFLAVDVKIFARRVAALWPIYLPSLLGFCLYLTVVVEPRYVVAFVIILVLTPLLALFVPTPLVSKNIERIALLFVALIAFGFLTYDELPSLRRVVHNQKYTGNDDWRTGLYLNAVGVAPGTKIAIVRVEHGIQATWAYVAKLHIVAQIGNQDLQPEEQQKDFDLFIKNADTQQMVFDLFRKSGATVVLALGVHEAPTGEGWTKVPGKRAWLHLL